MFILIVAVTPSNFLYADELSSDFVLGGRIVWSHNGDLLWANPDGNDNNIYRITDTPWVEKNPTISPDGRFVAYASNRNSDNWSLETGFSIEILELGANDVTQSIKMLTTPEDGNCMNPTWIWNDKFFTEETLDPNGIIAFDCTLYGDSGIFAKYPQKISGPKIAIRDELGRSETNPTFYEKGTADIGRFKDNYMFLWEEFKNAEGQIGINLGILSIGDFYPQEDDPCNINTYSMYSKCLNLRGSSWTFGIEGHSPSWFTGIPDSYNFPGSKGQHLFAFVREGNTPGTTKFMWATIPDENIFGRDDRREGELTSGIYGGFGINFTEVLEPKFSPFDQPVVAHYMRDTNPLKNDNGSLKILNSGDQITERIDISKFRPDFDWGEFDLIETVSQSGISMEQFRGRIAGRLDSDYEEKYTNEQERIELELKELQDLENLRIDQQAELMRKQQELDQIEFDNLSRERQDEIENQRRQLELEREELERQNMLDIERQKLELERQQFELEREMQQRELDLQNEQFILQRDNLDFSSNDRFSVYEEENCYVENENEGRGLFGNYEIGSEIDCDFGEDFVEKFDDPTNLAMLGLIVTVGATLLQMARGN